MSGNLVHDLWRVNLSRAADSSFINSLQGRWQARRTGCFYRSDDRGPGISNVFGAFASADVEMSFDTYLDGLRKAGW